MSRFVPRVERGFAPSQRASRNALMRNVNLVGREGGTQRDESDFQKCHESVHAAKFAAEN